MKKIGLIYWPKGGNVETTAKKIYEHFDKSYTDMYDAQSIHVTDLANYDCLIVGGSTTGSETWESVEQTNKWNALLHELGKVNLDSKKVAIFGLGNQVLWPMNFVDSMIVFKNEFEKHGATIVGAWPTNGYSFTDSASVVGSDFVGLAIDEDHESELTEGRIATWVEQIKREFGI